MKSTRSLFLTAGIVCASLFLLASLSMAKETKLRIIFTDTYAPHIERIGVVSEAFEASHPGVDVVVDSLSWGEALQKVTAMKAAGSPPDLLLIIPAQIWTLQQQGWLLPMDDVVEDLGGDSFFRKLPAYTKLDGHYWCVPKGSSPLHVEYRKDLFDEKGLAAPRTWDDLLAAAKALTEDLDGDGRTDRYGIVLPLKRDYAVSVFFLSFLWGNGGHVLDEKGNVVFNSPETIQTMEFFKKLYEYAPPGVTDYSWGQLVEAYSLGKAAMTIYSGMAPFSAAIRKNPTVADGTALAAIPTRLESQSPAARWVTTAWCMFKGIENPELAKEFVKFFMDVDRLIEYYHADPIFTGPGELPVIKSQKYWENDVIQQYRHILEAYIAAAEGAIDPVMEHPGIVQPNTTIINQRLLITDCIQQVVLQDVPPEKAVARAHEKMEELVEKLSK